MSTLHDTVINTLFDPPGTYGLTPYGRTHAVSLTGSHLFRQRAFNLFASFGGECDCGTHLESRPPSVRHSDRPDTIWFALPEARVQSALRLYLYTQLVRANLRDVVDEEGDFVEAVCDVEPALWVESEQLAIDFVVNHMPKDYGAIPVNEWDPREVVEHGFGSLGAAHTSDDSA